MNKYKEYCEKRKSLLGEYRKLIVERYELNKKIRKISEEMSGWDNSLLNGVIAHAKP